MAALLQDYSERAKEFKHSEFMPPYLPKNWYDAADKYFKDIDQRIRENGKGGRPPNVADAQFVASCAAVFSIIFDLQPTKTAAGSKSSTGLFAQFLEAIEATCHSRVIDPHTACFELPSELQRRLF